MRVAMARRRPWASEIVDMFMHTDREPNVNLVMTKLLNLLKNHKTSGVSYLARETDVNFNMRLVVMAVALCGCSAIPAIAQTYPSHSIRFVVTFPPGGTTDILAREIGAQLQERWKQTVVIDNRPGAGGNLGADIVAKAPPDGYTILLGTNGTHAINPSLYTKMPYDAIKDSRP